MMFFREQDILDVRKILKAQRPRLELAWIRARLEEIVGPRDPRMIRWEELVSELET